MKILLFALFVTVFLTVYMYVMKRRDKRIATKWAGRLLIPLGAAVCVTAILTTLALNFSIKVI